MTQAEHTDTAIHHVSQGSTNQLVDRYAAVRAFTEFLCEPLATEDYVVQTMPDVSPTKWHLAHTSWFFEAFVLSQRRREYQSPHPLYNYLFNSYYVQIGERFVRPQRGLLSRPTVREVYNYRRHVDEAMQEFFESADEKSWGEFGPSIVLGLHHEQQHQELLLTDIKHVLGFNPMKPVYRPSVVETRATVPPMEWLPLEDGVHWIGFEEEGFSFDNESPRHRQFVQPVHISSRLVTNGEYLEFMKDGGYQNVPLWLSEGSALVAAEGWTAPLYWENKDGRWYVFTLNGLREIDRDEPVCHVSYYEADAYARWAGARLPTEFEWEVASNMASMDGNFVESRRYHPAPLKTMDGLAQMFGDVWEWTGSAYLSYPGYSIPPGAIGEYNGKFMSGQMVLRGGSCATSQSHIRRTYRNFFAPHIRWQFSGIRLARDRK